MRPSVWSKYWPNTGQNWSNYWFGATDAVTTETIATEIVIAAVAITANLFFAPPPPMKTPL
jgi:hypothetical protein